MKFIILGRTEVLLDSAKALIADGHKLIGVISCRAAIEYSVGEDDFEIFAKDQGVPFLSTQKINSQSSIDFTKNLGEVDIAVSVNWISVVGSEFIELFPNGVLNAHGGDLPRYRGNACQAWAIINRERKIGLCIHKMVAGELDSGDIISRSYFNITIETRIGDVYDWMNIQIPKLFAIAVSNIQNDSEYVLEIQSKDPKDALRCYPRKPEDGKIDWNASAEEIVRLVNASSEPFEGAFCLDQEGAVLRIWSAAVFDDQENWCGVPGQVVRICEDKSIIMITGEGKIRINEIEIDSKRCKPGEIIKSIRTRLKSYH